MDRAPHSSSVRFRVNHLNQAKPYNSKCNILSSQTSRQFCCNENGPVVLHLMSQSLINPSLAAFIKNSRTVTEQNNQLLMYIIKESMSFLI